MTIFNHRIVVRSVAAAALLALAAGCATKAEVQQAQAEAAEAKRIAEEAQSMVQNARSMMQQAMEAARAAQAAADASQNCCNDLERKLDRALQDMQRK
ncbi:MAG: hypothetical protein RQ729_11910 [Wenzhouxiangellaceae bacterium]|nr:hypothetical protein [Wenzhouxiangellaceae bacterium]